MRNLGKVEEMTEYIGIIKWFGGMYGEKDYGFIRPCNGGEDVFIHRNGLKDRHIKLDEGTCVLYKTRKRKGRVCATNVDLLINHKTEDNCKLMRDLVYNHELRDKIAIQYILNWATLDEAEEYILKREKESKYFTQNLIRELPADLVLKSEKIRGVLDYEDQLDLLLNEESEISNEYREYFLNILKYIPRYASNQYNKSLCYQIYERFHCNDERLYKYVPDQYLDILIEKWRESEHNKNLEDSVLLFIQYRNVLDKLYQMLSLEEFMMSERIRGCLKPKDRLLILCNAQIINPNEYYEEFVTTLGLITGDSDIFTLDFLRKIYERFHYNDERFYKSLPASYMKVLIEQYKGNLDSKEYLNSLISFIKNKESRVDWKSVDWTLMSNNEIFQLAPPIIKVLFLTGQNRIENQQKILQLIDLAPKEQIQWYALNYGLNISENYEWFKRLSPIDQVKKFDERKTNWNWMSLKGKILYLYRLAKENKVLPPDFINKENHHLIFILYKMMISTVNEKNDIFEEFNEWLYTTIFNEHGNYRYVDLWPILPHCSYNASWYCEGRPWYNDTKSEFKLDRNLEAELIYCARCPSERKICNHKNIPYKGYARVYPRLTLSWEEWSIIEFMECYSIRASLFHIKDSREYITKISGWTNRIKEIYEKAECRSCKSILKANLNYSKKIDAAYNVTVFNCPNDGLNHDKNVYINHCWRCHQIIDSRESKVKVDNMYLCIYCGSGPRNEWYSPGQICPNCGEIDMKRIEFEGGALNYVCRYCNHSINVF